MPNIDELWDKYTTKEYHTQTWYREMTKENFTKAIAEIISSPVDQLVMPKIADVEKKYYKCSKR